MRTISAKRCTSPDRSGTSMALAQLADFLHGLSRLQVLAPQHQNLVDSFANAVDVQLDHVSLLLLERRREHRNLVHGHLQVDHKRSSFVALVPNQIVEDKVVHGV